MSFFSVKQASRVLPMLSDEIKTSLLLDLAIILRESTPDILAANAMDMDKMQPEDPMCDRLLLTEDRIETMAQEIENVARLPDPINELIEERSLPNGLLLSKVRVPLGVIGVIYESRPNVTIDVFSLCFRSGNACILKGGKEAETTNIFFVKLIHSVLKKWNLPEELIWLLPNDRRYTDELLAAKGYVDVIIPRGSKGLIEYVRDHAKVPTIETGAGIVHVYFDKSGDVQKGADIIFNSKTRRVSVCNALDCLILHQERLRDLPTLVLPLAEKKVILFADTAAYEVLHDIYPNDFLKSASSEHYGIEFLDYKIAIKTVDDLQEAIDHIYTHSSGHSESIVAQDSSTIEVYLAQVDAAAVYVNAATSFTDGAQFGLGAEIGISTQKLHARGPMALRELTSYKWIVHGDGHIRV